MNERLAIERIRSRHPILEGSRPGWITPVQQRASNLMGRLMAHAAKKGKLKRGMWFAPKGPDSV